MLLAPQIMNHRDRLPWVEREREQGDYGQHDLGGESHGQSPLDASRKHEGDTQNAQHGNGAEPDGEGLQVGAGGCGCGHGRGPFV